MKIEVGKSYRMTNGRVLTVTALGPGKRMEWTDKAERRKHFKNGSCDRGMFKVWAVTAVCPMCGGELTPDHVCPPLNE